MVFLEVSSCLVVLKIHCLTPFPKLNNNNVCACMLSHIWLFANPWTAARQVPLSLGLSRQEYWSGLPFPTPEDLPYSGIEPMSSVSPADRFFTAEPPRKPEKTMAFVQSLSHVWLFATPWTAECQAFFSFTVTQSLLKLMSIELVMPSNHIILCCPMSS